MSSIKPIKYDLYEIKGEKVSYQFNFDTLQEVKKHFSTRFDIPPEKVDQWYEDCPKWLKKQIKVVERD